MTFRIRAAVPGDGLAIARVQVASWKTTYRGIVPEAYMDSMDAEEFSKWWEGRLAEGEMVLFVAEDDLSGVFGFVSGGFARETIEGFPGELYAIYLLERGQRRGVGRELAARLGEALREKGLVRIFAWVLEANAAVSFYRRLGGVEIARKMVEIGGVELTELAFGWDGVGL